MSSLSNGLTAQLPAAFNVKYPPPPQGGSDWALLDQCRDITCREYPALRRSHPTRMRVGFYIWAIPTLVAFVQGAFRIGGTVAIHPLTMFLLIGLTMVMHAQCSILENLHKKMKSGLERTLRYIPKALKAKLHC